jgi:hypothetical protein
LKKINEITSYFVEGGPGRGSEDIKKEFNVNCFDFFVFSVFFLDVMGGKVTINLKELNSNRKRRNTCTPEKSQKRTIEKGRLSCDSDAPLVGIARSDSTRVVKVNRRKTRPYCTLK